MLTDMTEKTPKAVILLSGGLDSATVLALAKKAGFTLNALSLDYGQRHRAELDAAKRLAAQFAIEKHLILPMPLNLIGGSALTDAALEVPENQPNGIPITYVPARNTVFLSLALGWAEVLQANTIFIGVNALDYSGYPDCRPEYINAFQQMAALATKVGVEGNPIHIEAPLIHLSKAEIIQKGSALGVDYAATISCYQADDCGRACGRCDSCRLRAKGFADAGLADPTRYQTAAN